MKKRNVCVLLAAALSCSLVLTACGGDTTTSTSGGGTSTPSSASTSTGASSTDTSGTASGYTFRTSESNRVVTENGTFTSDQVTEPILITSFGQSADSSMLDALMKKTAAEFTFNATATADDLANYGTIIIASGASSKGLGAAGISEEDEVARAEAIVQAVQDSDVTVILAHLGGAARRGTLSDEFTDMALQCADYIMVVEEGNDDGKFTDAATDAGIPITLLYTIADATTPLEEIFGTAAQ